MFGILKGLAKASLGVAVTPVALVLDVVSIPATAYDDKHPFGETKEAGKLIKDGLLEAANKVMDDLK